jgi:hypothetical protein
VIQVTFNSGTYQQLEHVSVMVPDEPGAARVTINTLGHSVNFELRVRSGADLPHNIAWVAQGGVLVITVSGGIGPLGVALQEPGEFGSVAGATLCVQVAVHRIGVVNIFNLYVLRKF